MLVYDISERESFENLERWLVELRDHADEKIKVILVGNKSDLENKRKVPTAEGQKLADEEGKCPPPPHPNHVVVVVGIMFLESSALNANNVSTAFEMLVASIYEAL